MTASKLQAVSMEFLEWCEKYLDLETCTFKNELTATHFPEPRSRGVFRAYDSFREILSKHNVTLEDPGVCEHEWANVYYGPVENIDFGKHPETKCTKCGVSK